MVLRGRPRGRVGHRRTYHTREGQPGTRAGPLGIPRYVHPPHTAHGGPRWPKNQQTSEGSGPPEPQEPVGSSRERASNGPDSRGEEQREPGKGTPPAPAPRRVVASAPAVPAQHKTRASGIVPAATAGPPRAETNAPPAAAPPPPGLVAPRPKVALFPRRPAASRGVSPTIPAPAPRERARTRAASAQPVVGTRTPP